MKWIQILLLQILFVIVKTLKIQFLSSKIKLKINIINKPINIIPIKNDQNKLNSISNQIGLVEPLDLNIQKNKITIIKYK